MKEFIVSKIETSQDKGPSVYVALAGTKKTNFAPTRRQLGFPEYHAGIAAIDITSLDDLENLPKKISEAIEGAIHGGSSSSRSRISDSTTIKLNTTEYQDLDVKVGDKVTVEIKKPFDDP